MKHGFVVISDVHAHPFATFARGDGADNSRLQRTLAVLDASLARAAQDGVPWLMAGDIVHTAGYALHVVMAGLIKTLGAYPDVPKLAVWGNHDARGVGGPITMSQTVWAALEQAVPNLTVLDPSRPGSERVLLNGLTFSGAGAQPHNVPLRYATESDVGLYHGTVRGSVGPSGYLFEDGLDPAELLRRHRVAIVGDVHFPQQIEAPHGCAILIPGAPEHHDFGDVGQYGWWVLTLSDVDGSPEAEFVPGGSPEFRTVDTPDQVNSEHYYRVRQMPSGVVLPANATAIGSAPTVVVARNVLRGAAGDAVLQAWLKEEPPAESIDGGEALQVGRALLTSQEVRQLCAVQIASVQLKNFCSYVEQRFDVRRGTWLVVGKGRDFPSNGAGKSSLFEAIFWLLFGRTTKGLTGDEVIRRGATSCAVTGVIEGVDGRHLRVARARGAASTLRVTEFGPDAVIEWEAASVNEMTEKLSNRLGLTPELYQALGYFSQERLMLFASASDAERKEMLADLIGLSAYQNASSAAQREVAKLFAAAQRSAALLEAAQTQLASEQQRLSLVERNAATWWSMHGLRVGQASEAVAAFQASMATVRAERIAQGRSVLLSRIAVRRAELEALLAPLSAMTAPPACTEEDVVLSQSSLRGISEQLVATTTRLRELDGQLVKANVGLRRWHQALEAGVCPTCHQSVGVEHRAACVTPVMAEIEDLTRRIADERDVCDVLGKEVVKAKEHVAAVADSMRARQTWQRWQAGRAVTEGELARLREEEAQLDAVVAAHADAQLASELGTLEKELEHVTREINPHSADLATTRQRIADAQQGVKSYEKEEAATQRTMALYEYWVLGFSKQGIQSLLVDEVAALFNDARGSIFPTLTQGVYDVQFSTTSQTKGGEWRERTEFRIFEHGQPVPYAALSGGQRRRIDVGVMLVLVKAVSQWMRVPGVLGMLVLDEVFGFLDASGAEGLMEALREVQDQVPAIYAVSHDPQLQALFSDVLVVEQGQDGVSKIIEGV